MKGLADLLKVKKEKNSAPNSPATSRSASRTTSAKVQCPHSPCAVASMVTHLSAQSMSGEGDAADEAGATDRIAERSERFAKVCSAS